MFRRIVSNLPFSPALVGQLSFYARRLKKEELTRRIGLVFTALALVVQSLAVFSPPEAANASSNADFVPGGVSSMADFVRHYDNDYRNIKKIFNSLGIERSELQNCNLVTIGEASRYNWSMTSLYSHADGQRSYDYGPGTVYYRPMRLTQEGGDRHPVYACHSAVQGWFAIKKDCGNLITDTPPKPKPDPEASCVNLDVMKLDWNHFRFKGRAKTEDGADIRGYMYTVRNEAGRVVDQFDKNATTLQHEMEYRQNEEGKYNVTLKIRTSVGPRQDKQDCVGSFKVVKPAQPSAVCKLAKASVTNRTIVSLQGKAAVENGATIKKYVFEVKDVNGNVVKTISVDSDKEAVMAPSFTLAKPGTYTVKLTVKTSIGDVTDPQNCVGTFTIVPPEQCQYNPSLPANSPDCQPCSEDSDIWIKDERCNTELVQTKTATNLTQGNVDATTVKAKAGNKITYTIVIENRGEKDATNVEFKENLQDILEYSGLIDNGGGTFDSATKTLSWNAVTIPAKSKQSRTFAVQMLDPIPATNTGTSDGTSYDCMMTNTFGNSVNVAVECPIEKVIIEQTVAELPHTGPRENMIFAATLASVVMYFWARSRQLGKEVRLIRRDVHAGAI